MSFIDEIYDNQDVPTTGTFDISQVDYRGVNTPVTVEGFTMKNHFGIHFNQNEKGWTVTHLQTGKKLGQIVFKTEKTAFDYCYIWENSWGKVLDDPNEIQKRMSDKNLTIQMLASYGIMRTLEEVDGLVNSNILSRMEDRVNNKVLNAFNRK